MHGVILLFHILAATIWTGGHLVLCLRILPKALKTRSVDAIREFEASYEVIGIPALIHGWAGSIAKMEFKRQVYQSLASAKLDVKLQELPSEGECLLSQWYENPDVLETFGVFEGLSVLPEGAYASIYQSGKKALKFLLQEDWRSRLGES